MRQELLDTHRNATVGNHWEQNQEEDEEEEIDMYYKRDIKSQLRAIIWMK